MQDIEHDEMSCGIIVAQVQQHTCQLLQ